MTNSNKTIQGSCFCGQIRYQVELPSKFVVHCHCSECRRASGAAFVTWLGTWENRFKLIMGQENLMTYRPIEDSSRSFCSKCGSQLFFRCERWKDEVHVTLATLHDSADRLPQANVFYSNKATWYDPNLELPLFGGEDGTTELQKN